MTIPVLTFKNSTDGMFFTKDKKPAFIVSGQAFSLEQTVKILREHVQSNQIKKMTNDDYLYIKIPNLPFDQILVRHKETQILYNGQAISRQQVEAEARADERAKVMAEMKEVMDKLCPLASPNTKG